jgi:hypothetical protein
VGRLTPPTVSRIPPDAVEYDDPEIRRRVEAEMAVLLNPFGIRIQWRPTPRRARFEANADLDVLIEERVRPRVRTKPIQNRGRRAIDLPDGAYVK